MAVICSNMNTAREYYEILSELGSARLVQDADFSFRPGIDITIVEHIVGLSSIMLLFPMRMLVITQFNHVLGRGCTWP